MIRECLTIFSNGLEVSMSRDDALACSVQGDCEAAVRDLMEREDYDISGGAEDIRQELAEYGAWIDVDLVDDEKNLMRILWLAAGNIRDEEKE